MTSLGTASCCTRAQFLSLLCFSLSPYHVSIPPTLLFVVPLSFVIQTLFNQPSVLLQDELHYMQVYILYVRGRRKASSGLSHITILRRLRWYCFCNKVINVMKVEIKHFYVIWRSEKKEIFFLLMRNMFLFLISILDCLLRLHLSFYAEMTWR